jgi:hypothetical protein
MILNYPRLYDEVYAWLINNPTRKDEYGDQVTIGDVLRITFPNYCMTYNCYENNIEIETETFLTQEEQVLLQNAISQYQIIEE